jgi:hypothetical protein
MGDDETRDIPAAEQTIPQLGFGVDVEGRGQIVENQQLGLGGEHAGRRRALHLPKRSQS